MAGRWQRSFWLVATATVVVEVMVVGGAAWLVRQLVPCFWDVLPLPPMPACVVPHWPGAWMPWLAAGVLITAGAMTAAAAVTAATRQRRGTASFLRAALASPTSTQPRLAAAAGALDLPRVRQVDHPMAFAYTHGLIRPTVSVSTPLVDALDDQELAAVLAHERRHVLVRDPLRRAAMTVAARATFPLPALAALARHAAVEAELRADADAIAHVGEAQLVSALTKLLDLQRPEVGVAAVSAIDALADRIRYLTSGRRPPIEIGTRDLVTSAIALAALATLALLVLNALASVAGWTT